VRFLPSDHAHDSDKLRRLQGDNGDLWYRRKRLSEAFSVDAVGEPPAAI